MTTEQQVYERLASIFAEVFGRGDIIPRPELSARDVVGWDSFKQVEITLALEDQFEIQIRTRELNEVANLGDLVALVVAKADQLS